jgi:hypothetical protein
VSEDTEILNKKPLLKVLFELAMKRLETAILLAALAIWSNYDAHKEGQAGRDANSGTNWVGHSMHDAHEEIWSHHDAFLAYSNSIEQRMKVLEIKADEKPWMEAPNGDHMPMFGTNFFQNLTNHFLIECSGSVITNMQSK